MKEEVLRLERVTQIKDGVILLDNINFHIFKGEIMGLVCINAHGKEALVKLLSQNVPIHYGRVYFQENLVNNYEHSSMSINPVAVIEKQSRLVEGLTVADNIFVMRKGFRDYIIDAKKINERFREFTEKLNIQIDGNEVISNLSYFDKCVVEIIKAVVTGVKLIILRDISNFISAVDLIKIHEIIKYYSKQGVSFLYICNHHEETFKICDRVALMENGKVLKVLRKQEFHDDKIKPYILDFRHIPSPSLTNTSRSGVLQFRNVSTDNINDMSFTVEKGESVVILDRNNTALTDIMQLMNNEIRPLSGDILVDGRCYSKEAMQLKKCVCLIQENPIETMLFKEMSYIDNLCFLVDKKIPYLWQHKRFKKSVILEYEPLVGEDIYAHDITCLSALSLYNLVYYRVHLYRPKIVFCMQPFSGADMYLRHHLIQLFNKLRKKNITLIILAVSISDSLAVADRLMIVEQGMIKKEYPSDKFNLFRESH